MSDRTPLDDLDHLTRSPHRARVIQLFAADDWTRRELHEETDIPQPTLGRILGSFQDRDWLTRDGDTFSLTLRGQLIADQFADLLDTFETALKLPEAVDFEPILDLGFDPQWLAVVDVTTPVDQTDWYGHLRQVRKSVDQLLADELRVDSIFPRETFESLAADPEERSLFADLLRTGNASIHLVDDSIRYYVARHGDRAVIDVPATTGGPVVRLATDHRAVLDWVDSTIDEFCARADPVTLDDLADW